MSQQVYDWRNVAGPVAHAYEQAKGPMSLIIGPTAGGKTQASARKCLNVALWQHPSPRDGIRKARITCVAPTYPLLWDAPIPSFRKVFPDSLGGKFTGTPGRPADYSVDMNIQWGSTVMRLHLEVQFRAIKDGDIEEFVRGRENTAWWLPEMDQAPEGLLSLLQNRVGRYPEPADRPPPEAGLGPAFTGTFGDANAPVEGGWFHKRFYVDASAKKKTVLEDGTVVEDKVFYQPPGVLSDGSANPNAENIHNLRNIRPDYYAWLKSTMDEYDIRRLLQCKPGWSRNGKPVHEHFDHARHVAIGALSPEPGLLLRIGVDAGNTLKPAATFSQSSWSGQKRVLDEISPVDVQMDLTEFAREVRRKKDTRFRDVKNAVIIVDPSAAAATTMNRQITYARVLQDMTGIEVRLAPSNDPGLRRTAVDQRLRRSAGPGEAALIIDPVHCPRLIQALGGGYRFKKVGDTLSPRPEKNDHSHEAEALQYDEIDDTGLGAVEGGLITPHWSPSQSDSSATLPD